MFNTQQLPSKKVVWKNRVESFLLKTYKIYSGPPYSHYFNSNKRRHKGFCNKPAWSADIGTKDFFTKKIRETLFFFMSLWQKNSRKAHRTLPPPKAGDERDKGYL